MDAHKRKFPEWFKRSAEHSHFLNSKLQLIYKTLIIIVEDLSLKLYTSLTALEISNLIDNQLGSNDSGFKCKYGMKINPHEKL